MTPAGRAFVISRLETATTRPELEAVWDTLGADPRRDDEVRAAAKRIADRIKERSAA